MSESLQHRKLVKIIIEEVEKMVSMDQRCFIETDMDDSRPLPQLTVEGFRPDVAFQYDDMLIIGEAKTSDDVDRLHSLMQYESYIKKCSLFHGKASFIIAVPWMEYAVVYNITRRIQKKYPGTYSIKILKGLGI